MLAVTVCLAGVLGLMLVAEVLSKQKILGGENLRKFIHISLASFIAFWPWLISWRSIQLIAVAMLAAAIATRRFPVFKFAKGLHRQDYGDIFLALAILVCAAATTNKIFFALAILEMAWADGLAAVIGKKYGVKWRYKVLNQTKTIFGSMAFWFISVIVLGIGLLWAHNYIDYRHYSLLLLALPPVLTAIENLSVLGLDNITIPISVLIALEALKV